LGSSISTARKDSEGNQKVVGGVVCLTDATLSRNLEASAGSAITFLRWCCFSRGGMGVGFWGASNFYLPGSCHFRLGGQKVRVYPRSHAKHGSRSKPRTGVVLGILVKKRLKAAGKTIQIRRRIHRQPALSRKVAN